jgi:hypothetical protein
LVERYPDYFIVNLDKVRDHININFINNPSTSLPSTCG